MPISEEEANEKHMTYGPKIDSENVETESTKETDSVSKGVSVTNVSEISSEKVKDAEVKPSNSKRSDEVKSGPTIALEEILALFTALMKSYNAFMAGDLNQTSMVSAELDQIHPEDVEEMDVTWQMAMAVFRAKNVIRKTGKNKWTDKNKRIGFNKDEIRCFNFHEKENFSRECKKPKMEKTGDSTVASSYASENGKALVAQESGGYSWRHQHQALNLEEPHAFMADIASSATSEIKQGEAGSSQQAKDQFMFDVDDLEENVVLTETEGSGKEKVSYSTGNDYSNVD
ncbi:hypothetical protein R6Q57_016069 [Mikania cordata]